MARGQILKGDSLKGHSTDTFSYAQLSNTTGILFVKEGCPEGCLCNIGLAGAQTVHVFLRVNFFPHPTIRGEKKCNDKQQTKPRRKLLKCEVGHVKGIYTAVSRSPELH